MGQLLFGAGSTFEVEDRTLAHLETVTLAKLRRKEAFALTLEQPDGGHATIWINPSSVLQFHYSSDRPEINRAWLESLIDAANTPAGIRTITEP